MEFFCVILSFSFQPESPFGQTQLETEECPTNEAQCVTPKGRGGQRTLGAVYTLFSSTSGLGSPALRDEPFFGRQQYNLW